MPQVDWTPEFKRSTTMEFDRLKLKVGERARIVALEKPTFTWVHTLRAPKIVDGRANKVIKKRKDGSEFADWDMDFIGRPQCLGDHGIIAEDSLDAANCPICARAKVSEECAAPERRFGMNIIKYNTRADGTPVSPFGCSSLVWVFTEGIFNKLYDIAQEYGGLVGRDLILGPCIPPETYQKFDISAGAKNLWESDDAITNTVKQTHVENRVDNMEAAIARRAEARWLTKDVDKVAERWAIANGKPPASSGSEAEDVKTLKGELDSLLAPTAPLAATEPGVTTSNVMTYPDPQEDTPVTAAPAASDPDNFADLLKGLKI